MRVLALEVISMRSTEGREDAADLSPLIQPGSVDTTVPRFGRFKWPKRVPPLSAAQEAVADDFVKHWHHVLPKRYGAVERFNHTYPLRHVPEAARWRTLELGAGIGGHLEFEPLGR
jgi:hypothetical protein